MIKELIEIDSQGMFTGAKYITKGVNEDIPLETQIKLYSMIADMTGKVTKVDSLQSFELKIQIVDGKRVQIIIHSQEIPKYSSEVIFETDHPVVEKLFVISDTDEDGNPFSTMLKRSEY